MVGSRSLLYLKQMFCYDDLIFQINKEIISLGFFRNHAGRPVFPTTSSTGTLFNNYCQSSAVDVALSGFSNLLQAMHANSLKSVPLCFIHDAILIDVHPAEMNLVKEYSSLLATYLDIEFPTKLRVVNN